MHRHLKHIKQKDNNIDVFNQGLKRASTVYVSVSIFLWTCTFLYTLDILHWCKQKPCWGPLYAWGQCKAGQHVTTCFCCLKGATFHDLCAAILCWWHHLQPICMAATGRRSCSIDFRVCMTQVHTAIFILSYFYVSKITGGNRVCLTAVNLALASLERMLATNVSSITDSCHQLYLVENIGSQMPKHLF